MVFCRTHSRAAQVLLPLLLAACLHFRAPAADTSSHWAFQPVRNPSLPAVQRVEWPLTPVDHFILATLESHQLKPAPRASKRALLRRLSLDLLGLPPTLAAIEAFENDNAPGAWERAVERYLASPQYGERWGRYWLDVARYADTKGYVFYYEESQFVQPHRYRDWVIQAINADMPYGRFLEYQIAADQMLLQASAASAARPLSNQASTASPASTEGHPDLAALGFLTLGRRFLGNPHDIIDDQLDVLMRGTQGLTMGCARCHDHKFDPVSMADYYALYGVMQSSQERLLPLGQKPAPDSLMTYAEASARIEFERELRQRVEKLETAFQSACSQVADRLRNRVTDYLVAVTDRDRLPTVSANVRPAPDDINPFNVRQWSEYLQRRRSPMDSVFFAWNHFTRSLSPAATAGAATTGAAWPLPSGPNAAPALNPRVLKAFAQAPTSLPEVARIYGQLFTNVVGEWRAALADAKARQSPEPKGLTDPAAEELRQVLYASDSPVLAPGGSIVELDVHLYFDDPNRVALSKMQMEVEQWVNTAPNAPPHAVGLVDRPTPVNGRIFNRGDPSRPGAEVPRRYLTHLGGSDAHPFGHGSGRLDLARSITDPANPLTSRVWVNRVWAHHFGTGLVPTQSDFGARSEPPSHPELLDWLAFHFQHEGGSLKQLHRWIVLSATYQQSSMPDSGNPPDVDPQNRWVHHYPKRRLDFEAMRDSILSATGELDLKPGGKAFDLESEPIVARRTVYGRVDRRFIPPVLRSFDVANPDIHSPQRHTTTVPQQALYFLNSPWLTGRARALSRRAERDSLDRASAASFVDALYQCVHVRPPTARERELGVQFLGAPAEGTTASALSRRDQLAQVLLMSNELAHIE